MDLVNIIIGSTSLIGLLYLIWKISSLENSVKYRKSESKSSSNREPKKNRISHFLGLIKKANGSIKYDLAKHCFNREPASYDLLCVLWELHKEAIAESMPNILQRDMIQDMSNAIVLYRQMCDIEDIEKTNSISEELEQLSSEVLKRLKMESRDLLKRQLTHLQALTEALSSDSENKDILKELEKLDNSLNKDLIETVPELQKEYRKVSDKLLLIFTQEGDDQEDTAKKEQAYNLKAINKHKKALELFEADTGFLEENNFKKGTGLSTLVGMIGGWDNRYLLPSTISYANTIYGTIFSKLKKEAQLSITKMMVHEKKKPL